MKASSASTASELLVLQIAFFVGEKQSWKTPICDSPLFYKDITSERRVDVNGVLEQSHLKIQNIVSRSVASREGERDSFIP